MDATPAIATRGLTKAYGPVVALDSLDLDVPVGSVFGLLGPSGAGKTTALRLIAGLARPTDGSVTVAGLPMEIDGSREARRHIGMLDQAPRFYGWMTGRELLAFVADLVGIDRLQIGPAIDQSIEEVGLGPDADRPIGGYTAAQRARIGIAQALIGRPDVLLLDEPVGALDPPARSELLGIIGALGAQATVVITSPEPDHVERICDRVAVLDHGRLVVDARLDALVGGGVTDTAYLVELDAGQGLALAGLVALLGRQHWVRAAATQDGVLRVTVADASRAARELLPAIVASGVSVASFRRERPTLRAAVAELVDRHRAEVDGP